MCVCEEKLEKMWVFSLEPDQYTRFVDALDQHYLIKYHVTMSTVDGVSLQIIMYIRLEEKKKRNV